MWSNCLKYLVVLSKWLAWHLGNGSRIRLEVDPIMGLGDNYKLSEGLLNDLHE